MSHAVTASHAIGQLARILLTFSLVFAVIGCDNSQSSTSVPAPAGQAAPGAPQSDNANVLILTFPYGSEKKAWINEVTQSFNEQQIKGSSGKVIRVNAIPMGSGESVTEIVEERLQAHLVSPASTAFIRLGNAQAQQKFGHDLVGDTRELVLSPVVIAMWKPMADAIGYGSRPIGWSDVLELVGDEKGWAHYGFPQWGRFKFGHTHPEYSNSGLISLLAEVYAATGKSGGLTLEDVNDPKTATFLRNIERGVVHYGSSTGFFGTRMFSNGPGYLSAAVMYENMVIESYDRQQHPNIAMPVVAIYPREGTFWSDHPVGIVNASWVNDEHRAAAQLYVDFLLASEQQQKAMQFGFRPADATIAIAAPFDAEHGVDPNEPKTTLEVPSVQVMNAIIDLWKEQKKHSRIALLLDTSGSMQGDKIANAVTGAKEFINVLGKADQVSIYTFETRVHRLSKNLEVGLSREQLLSEAGSVIANGGTALHDAIAEAQSDLVSSLPEDRICAIVVLSDGDDRNSRMKLAALLQQVGGNESGAAVRIFTIGYGDGADETTLKQIAEQTQGKYYKGSTDNIRDVFKDISTFF